MEEADLIEDDKITPESFEFAADLKSLLELVCEVSHEGGEGHEDHHEDDEHHEDEDHTRRLDGHETAAPPMPVTEEHHDGVQHMEDDMEVTCLKAYRLLDSMEEYAKEDTTEERR